jgi:hypothetical protein
MYAETLRRLDAPGIDVAPEPEPEPEPAGAPE